MQLDKNWLKREFNADRIAHLAIDLQEGCYRPKERTHQAFLNTADFSYLCRILNITNIWATMPPHNQFKIVKPQDEEPKIEKEYSSAFKETELKQTLEKKNISTLIVTGVHYDLCVAQTVRDALANNLKVIVLLDCINIYRDSTEKMIKEAKKCYGDNVILCNSKDITDALSPQ